ncbi:uncharacterized protein MAM_00542 [Metarhizium album ARSEF 1941]|uniref:Extracellular mutant protein 11 C-terminal domain-containing protein n=1 Tax=Metarhizium album (strain ARSEF 1941) TaxID=1081103 RepID=A0A0B2X8A5_METAS|nr:uncharacterized protein MAM_00542 [Metarhizium album ARSEF 1941]KHO01541.1 hypothetical protein MAM_00542 [Metarhizium album ARSEF 1941]
MQPGLKAKSRGLQAFARGKSDSNANYNAATDKPTHCEPEKRSVTPNAKEYIPTRQELAEFARLPLPGAVRKPPESPRLGGQLRNLQKPQSPARQPVNKVSATQSQHEIFNGSQLGENFMISGLSTPANDSEDLIIRRTPDIKVEDPRQDRNQIQRLPPRQAPVASSREHEFALGADGRLSVVPGVHRYHPSLMKDGFYTSEAQPGPRPFKSQKTVYSFPIQSAPGQAKLPMRGVRIHRGQLPGTNALPVQEDKVRDKFIEGRGGKWEQNLEEEKLNESILVNDSDDDFDALGAFGNAHAAPKSKMQNGHRTKLIREDGLASKSTQNAPAKEKKRRRPSLDYDDKVLSSMTYQDLQEEPFDLVPQLLGMNGHDMSTSKLVSRLEQFQQQGEHEQRQFFANMSIEDWEDSGDWFAAQFTDMMKRLRNARREKRQMIRSFETEASHREEAIRLRTDAIDRKLAKMKQDGQRVVGDKDL